MGAALALAARGRGRTAPNPAVGCIIVKNGVVAGRGWTRPGGRPHAEAEALVAAGEAAAGATVYVTLEPCAHESERGPACADLLTAARPARVVVAAVDPDARTAGRGLARLREAGIDVAEGIRSEEAAASQAGFRTRVALGRPRVTLKLAASIDGRIALESGESQWITGEEARAHAHLMRAEADAILIGRGTLESDQPALTVRLPGLEDRSPVPLILSGSLADLPDSYSARGGRLLRHSDDLHGLPFNDILVEGGAGLAGTLLAADMVDRLLIYRAPILIGDGAPGAGRIGLADLGSAHGRWRRAGTRALGPDMLEVYRRTR